MKIVNSFSFLAQMSPESWVSFHKYIHSRYARHKLLREAALFLKPHHPAFRCHKEKLYKALYGDEMYDSNKLAQVLHRLQHVALEYIGSANSDLVQSQIQTHLYLKESKIDRLYKKSKTKIEAISISNDSLHSAQALHLLAFQDTNEILEKGIRSTEPHLQRSHDTLDAAYIQEKLILSCSALNYARLSQQVYQLGVIDYLDEYLLKHITKSQTYHFLFYKIYRFLSGEDRAFEEVVAFLQKNKLNPSDTSSMVYTYCINYCIGKINSGDLSYFKTLFVVYQSQIKSLCIYDVQSNISPATLKNIVTVSIRNNELKWANEFVKNQADHLLEQHREVVYNYCLALLQYENKSYKKSIQLILQSKPTDFLDNISMRVLHIKSLWALEDNDGIDGLLSNFKLYLLRHKNKGYHYTFHINFIKVLDKINNMKTHSPKEKKEIENYIVKIEKVAEKKWLMEVLK
jgi:hypothetical protein